MNPKQSCCPPPRRPAGRRAGQDDQRPVLRSKPRRANPTGRTATATARSPKRSNGSNGTHGRQGAAGGVSLLGAGRRGSQVRIEPERRFGHAASSSPRSRSTPPVAITAARSRSATAIVIFATTAATAWVARNGLPGMIPASNLISARRVPLRRTAGAAPFSAAQIGCHRFSLFVWCPQCWQ